MTEKLSSETSVSTIVAIGGAMHAQAFHIVDLIAEIGFHQHRAVEHARPARWPRARQPPQAHRDALPPREKSLENEQSRHRASSAQSTMSKSSIRLTVNSPGVLPPIRKPRDVARRRRARARKSRSARRRAASCFGATDRHSMPWLRGSLANSGGRGTILRARQQAALAHNRISRSDARARCRHRACRHRRRATSVSYQPRAVSGRPSGPSIGAISASAMPVGARPR